MLWTIYSSQIGECDLSAPKTLILPKQRTKFSMKVYKERRISSEEGGRFFKIKEQLTYFMIDWLELACTTSVGKGYNIDRLGTRPEMSREFQYYIKESR